MAGALGGALPPPAMPSMMILSEDLSMQVPKDVVAQLFRDLVRLVVHDAPWEAPLRATECESMLQRITGVMKHRSPELNNEGWIHDTIVDIRREPRTSILCALYATLVGDIGVVFGRDSRDLCRRPANFPSQEAFRRWRDECEGESGRRMTMANERGSAEHAVHETELRIHSAVQSGDAKLKHFVPEPSEPAAPAAAADGASGGAASTARAAPIGNRKAKQIVVNRSCFGDRLLVAVHYLVGTDASKGAPPAAGGANTASASFPTRLGIKFELVSENPPGGVANEKWIRYGEVFGPSVEAWNTDPYVHDPEPCSRHPLVVVPGSVALNGGADAKIAFDPLTTKQHLGDDVPMSDEKPVLWWRQRNLSSTTPVYDIIPIPTEYPEAGSPYISHEKAHLEIIARERVKGGCCGSDEGAFSRTIRIPLAKLLYEKTMPLGSYARYWERDASAHFWRGLYMDPETHFGAYVSVHMQCASPEHATPMPTEAREEFQRVDHGRVGLVTDELQKAWRTVDRHQSFALLADAMEDLTDEDVELLSRYRDRYFIHPQWEHIVIACTTARRTPLTSFENADIVHKCVEGMVGFATSKDGVLFSAAQLIADSTKSVRERILAALAEIELQHIGDPRRAADVVNRCVDTFELIVKEARALDVPSEDCLTAVINAVKEDTQSQEEELENELKRIARSSKHSGAAAQEGVEKAAALIRYTRTLLGNVCNALEFAHRAPEGRGAIMQAIASQRVAEAGARVVGPLKRGVPLIIGIATQLRNDPRQDELMTSIASLFQTAWTYADQLQRHAAHQELANQLVTPFVGFAMHWLTVSPDQAQRWIAAFASMPLLPVSKFIPGECVRVNSLSVGHFNGAMSELIGVFGNITRFTEWYQAAASVTRFATMVYNVARTFLETTAKVASNTTGQAAAAAGHAPAGKRARWIELLVAVANLHMIPDTVSDIWDSEVKQAIGELDNDIFLDDPAAEGKLVDIAQRYFDAPKRSDPSVITAGIPGLRAHVAYFVEDTVTGFLRRWYLAGVCDDIPAKELAKPRNLTLDVVVGSLRRTTQLMLDPLGAAMQYNRHIFDRVAQAVAEALADVVAAFALADPTSEDVASNNWALDLQAAAQRMLVHESLERGVITEAHAADDATEGPVCRYRDRTNYAQSLRKQPTQSLIDLLSQGSSVPMTKDRAIPVKDFVAMHQEALVAGELPRCIPRQELVLRCLTERAEKADQKAVWYCVNLGVQHVPLANFPAFRYGWMWHKPPAIPPRALSPVRSATMAAEAFKAAD